MFALFVNLLVINTKCWSRKKYYVVSTDLLKKPTTLEDKKEYVQNKSKSVTWKNKEWKYPKKDLSLLKSIKSIMKFFLSKDDLKYSFCLPIYSGNVLKSDFQSVHSNKNPIRRQFFTGIWNHFCLKVSWKWILNTKILICFWTATCKWILTVFQMSCDFVDAL